MKKKKKNKIKKLLINLNKKINMNNNKQIEKLKILINKILMKKQIRLIKLKL